MTLNIQSPPQVRLLPADYSTSKDRAEVVKSPLAQPYPKDLINRKTQDRANKFLAIGIDWLEINDISFEDRLDNWVNSADESEKTKRIEAKKRILEAKEYNAVMLYLSYLDLTDVPPVELPNLKLLYLTHNKLEHLSKGRFSELKSLEELYLHNNKIGNLYEGCFSELKSLKKLYLHKNKIGNLPDGCLDGLTLLRTISI